MRGILSGYFKERKIGPTFRYCLETILHAGAGGNAAGTKKGPRMKYGPSGFDFSAAWLPKLFSGSQRAGE